MKYSLFRRILALLMMLIMLAGCVPALAKSKIITLSSADYPVTEDGWYDSMEEVAVYLELFKKLPENYITKNEADQLGWKTKGDLDDVAPGRSIGGDRFGNYEKSLPDKKGRKWTECDIDYTSGSRNAKRIVFSNDGLIYYTADHYNTFTQIKVTIEEASAEVSFVIDPQMELDEYGEYTSVEEVTAYLIQYGMLPCNFITKAEAKELGWTAKKDNLGQVMPGCSIGGDKYHNREKLLPAAKGRTYYECDVNAPDGKRTDERIVYSSDGLIYYTPDGFETFIRLY